MYKCEETELGKENMMLSSWQPVAMHHNGPWCNAKGDVSVFKDMQGII